MVDPGVSTSPELMDWKLDGTSRSSWDILWTCFSTLVACTWTVIHADVPAKQVSDARRTLQYLRTWVMTLLMPEWTFAFAFLQFTNAIHLRKQYNEAQKSCTADTDKNNTHEVKKLDHSQPKPRPDEWKLSQVFCIDAGGFALLTKDLWIYTVTTEAEMIRFIQCGILTPSDLQKREIDDRSKADSFAKFFTLLQSTWFLVNIIVRWINDLPVSPIEIFTVAYVFLALFTYGFWWFKPKDMTTPITVPLPFNRHELPSEVITVMATSHWVHLKDSAKDESVFTILLESVSSAFLSRNSESFEAIREPIQEPWLDFLVTAIYGTICLVYCGIHLAAWDFPFATRAEWIVWIVCSFITIGAVCAFNTVNLAWQGLRYVKDLHHFPSFLSSLEDTSRWERARRTHLLLKGILIHVYVLARLGIMALVFSSFRALPELCYTTIDWVASIPHF